jgi:RNA polymerase sigma factor (sigma-70 family)
VTNLSEDRIISGIRQKDDLALATLYKAYYSMIVNLVCTNSGTEQEAKDIYQEAVIVLYEKIQSADFRLTCTLKTYIYAVCRRLWLKRLSEKKRYPAINGSAETFDGIAEEMQDIEEKEHAFTQMKTSLHGLGEPCRTIIEDFYIHDLSMEAIRDKFGYTNADNAKNQKYKCLQRLKKLFFERPKGARP